MSVEELVEKLYEYNPEAEISVIVNNKEVDFTLTYGDSEGVNKQNCETVGIYIDELNINEKK